MSRYSLSTPERLRVGSSGVSVCLLQLQCCEVAILGAYTGAL